VGKQRILARLGLLALGHWGDCKAVGESVTELRIHIGPGYRVYCWQDGAVIVVALCGGDKGSQERDIAEAQAMAQQLKTEKSKQVAKSPKNQSGKKPKDTT
jgi:putative addiction module killer protein